MARHKWQEEEVLEYGTKPHVCVKCRIRKMWNGGDFQAWEYSWNELFTAINGKEDWRTHKSWQRPECVGKKRNLKLAPNYLLNVTTYIN